MTLDPIDREASHARLVRAYRNACDLTLMEVRKDFHGIASARLGVLAITEDKDGNVTARIESVEVTGIEIKDSILRNPYAE